MNHENTGGHRADSPAGPAPGEQISTSWQLARAAAERYQEVLVPTILGPFAQALVETVDIAAGDTVADIGCGTGAATRPAARRAGTGGRVIGIDINDGMLAVAASLPLADGASIEWRQCSADRLPLEDGSIDVVLCAQMLQFLPIRSPVVNQMRRVLADGGRLGVSTWCRLPENPYFQAVITAVATHLGEEAAGGLRALAMLGGQDELRSLLELAPWRDLSVTVIERELALPPLEQFVARQLAATPLAAAFAGLSAAAQAALVDEVAAALQGFRQGDGTVRVPFRSNVATALA